MGNNWPFQEPRRVAVRAPERVHEGSVPILLVVKDRDGTWSFLPGPGTNPERLRRVTLEDIVALDPTIASIASLPRGWTAWRGSATERWTRHELLERHESPDHTLVLEVVRDEGRDVTIHVSPGWHTHADILAALRQEDEDSAWRGFVDEVLSSETPIAVYWKAGVVTEVAPLVVDTFEEVLDDPYLDDDEAITFRMWDGTAVGPQPEHDPDPAARGE